jgi:uncharacterized membrane protein
MKFHRGSSRFVAMLLLAIVTGVLTGIFGEWAFAATVGWAFAALLYSGTVWLQIGKLDAEKTKSHASREDPSRGTTDLLVILLSVASLFSVAFVLVHAAQTHGAIKGVLGALALVSVALSWIMLHTLFTLRYANIYYTADEGVDFNQDDPPRYTDFAYLAFTLGMTYQVSDTDLKTHQMRGTALRHALLSFVFGSVILASTINLVAQLSS